MEQFKNFNFKPIAWSVVAGSVATMIIGFSWGGWTTSGTTERLAADRSRAAVTAALARLSREVEGGSRVAQEAGRPQGAVVLL